MAFKLPQNYQYFALCTLLLNSKLFLKNSLDIKHDFELFAKQIRSMFGLQT